MTEATRPRLRLGRRDLRVLGGVAAQGSQAVGSFTLQILAAKLLGLEGLGRFAALFAIVILATAVCSGFVGDSLTVLDRSRPDVRAGLEGWLLIIVASVGLLTTAGAWGSEFVNAHTAVAFGGATAAFVVEDTLRRLLMVSLQFWRIVVVDISGLIGSLVVIVLADRLAPQLTLAHFLVALMVGQLLATLVAVGVLERTERHLAGLRHASMRAVAAYGAWRAVQQAVRPSLLALVRVVCLLVVSTEAVGSLEAARIYMAPAILAVAGVSSFLFASYAARRSDPLPSLVRLADRSVLTLLVGISAFGIVALAVMPWLAPLLTGDEYDLSVVAVVGWAAYAAALAAVTPYASLAAVRGRQAAVLGLRVGDSLVCLALASVVVVVDDSVEWVPLALAVGSMLGGLSIREFVLIKDLEREQLDLQPIVESR